MTSHELVIRLGRPFDVQTDRGFFVTGVREVTVPFADQKSADAALREVTVSVRAVHDAGAEDYRTVVAGEVMQTAEEAKFAGDLAGAGRRERARAAIPAPESAPSRDMNDWRG